MDIEVALDARLDLGEGPIWDRARRTLLFVDIMQGHVHEFDPVTKKDRIVDVGQPVGAVTPAARGDWVIAAQRGFFRVDPAGSHVTLIAPVEETVTDNRMNDGYCDPRGRFWAGTMSISRRPHAAAVYRLDPDGRATRVVSGISLSNGLDWSLDGRLMYYIDTPTGRIDVFDFDEDAGEVSNRRPFVTIADREGHPDGLIVDADGYIWLALWGSGLVRRYAPDARLDREIAMPVPHPTKCAFGGEDLSDLYITSASTALSDKDRLKYPTAGSVFRCRPGVKGRPAHPFAG